MYRFPEMHRLRIARPNPSFRFEFRPRLPRLRPPWSPRPTLELERLQRLGEPLQFFFYLLMFVAFLAIVTGAAGTGIAMLIAGAALHVGRASIVEVAAAREARQERAQRKREVRLRSHRAARKAPPERPPAAPRHRPRTPAGKQRVI